MKANKFVLLFIILLTVFIGAVNVFAYTNGYGEEIPGGTYNTPSDEANLSTYTLNNCSNNGSCFKGLGLRLKLIRYDKNESNEERVISTIYIINPNMLKDTVLVNGVTLPNSEADFGNSSFDLTYLDPSQYDNKDNPEDVVVDPTLQTARQDGGTYRCADGSSPTSVNNVFMRFREHMGSIPVPGCGSSNCPQVSTSEYSGVGYVYDNSECRRATKDYPTLKASEALTYHDFPFHWGFVNYIFKYKSGYQKVIYLAKSPYLNMNGADDYIADTDITEENIAHNYLDNNIMKKYAGSLEKVEKYFKVKLSSTDIGRYYIQVEGIYRVYLDKKDTPTMFLVKTIIYKACEEGIAESLDQSPFPYQPDSATECSAASQMTGESYVWKTEGSVRRAQSASCSEASCNNGDTLANRKACCKAAKATWTEAVDEVPTKDVCSKSCSSSDHSCIQATIKKWWPDNHYCGEKHYHMIYGTQWYGYSELRYTMSSKNESCDTNKSTTSLVDLMENNKHCNIADDDNEYTQQELANQCANTGYKYYIGPDPERALVSTASDAKYNLYGSDGNKCRSGVKRYYVLDIKDPDMCKTVCKDAGSKDSNSYLQCAENYCDHDVDYTLGGQPFVRKRDCILNACGYTYGNVPTMGDKRGAGRQATSSCANSKLFKTGEDTTFSLEKVAYNSTSSCGLTALGNISKSEGKDSVCIGDTVTDFNGTDVGDTPFDQRTYINVACQETESITSIGGISNNPINAGLPITYAINTKGQVTCVAFFNYEQWKVDYASIPSQDIIRRKRLDYIYNKFNNLMTNEYVVSSSLSDFYAYGLDGKTMEHWTITESDGLGQVKWDDYTIDINNSEARSESKETLKNGTTKNQTEDPLTNATMSKATLSVVPSEMDLTEGVYKAYTTGDKNAAGVINSDKRIIKVANNSISTPGTGTNGNTELIGYVQTTTDTKSYVYAKYCVDKEGKVYAADSFGVCNDDKEGKNAFYTDLNDVENLNRNIDIHNIKGTVTVESSLPSSNMEIYKNEDVCPITIKGGPSKSAYCKFKIISGDSYGAKTFLNGSGVEVMIEFYDYNGVKIKPESFTVNIKSPYRNEVSTNKYNKLSLKTAALAIGLEDITMTGNFTYSGSSTEPCSIELSLVQKGNMCEIEKKESKVYNVNTTVTNPKAVMGGMLNQRINQDYYGDHLPTNLGRLGRPKNEGGLYKYLLDLQRAEFDNQTVVVGYVNNGSKGEFCFRPEITNDDFSGIKQCVKNTTTGFGLYLPGQYTEITEYCKENWAIDTYGYESESDCVNTCARCPTHENEVIGYEEDAHDTQDNLKIVNDFCDAYATYGYASKETCVSLVYDICINPGSYKYRPVNSSNPFPSAVDNASIAPGYNIGDRIIGSNWKGKEHYITEGNPNTPRYQIALTTDRIRRIKNEVTKDNIAGIYTQLNPVKDSVESKTYMSRYIRDTNYFYDMFCYIQGVRTNSTTGGCEIK